MILNNCIIVMGFPGTGKSVACDGIREIYVEGIGYCILMDFESSNFGWYTDGDGNRRRMSIWPHVYIEFIKETIKVFGRPNKTIVAFTSSHVNVRDELIRQNLEFRIVYPSKERKDEFIERYKQRGNDVEFIKNLDEWFELWIDSIESLEYDKCKKIRFDEPMQYIGTSLETILKD